jgi:hypothetical protein
MIVRALLRVAERTSKWTVRNLIDEKGVDLVAASQEVVGDSHQVLDDNDDFFEGEDDRAVRALSRHGLAVRARGLGPELLDVLNTKGTHPWRNLDRLDAPGPDRTDELTRAESRLTHCITRPEHAPRDDLSSCNGATTGADDIRLADVADQRADLPRRHAESVRLDDRRVPHKASDVVVDPGALVLLFSLHEVPACRIEFTGHRLTISP